MRRSATSMIWYQPPSYAEIVEKKKEFEEMIKNREAA